MKHFKTDAYYRKLDDGSFEPVLNGWSSFQILEPGTWLVTVDKASTSVTGIDPQYELVSSVMEKIKDDLAIHIRDSDGIGWSVQGDDELKSKFNRFCSENNIHWIEYSSAYNIISCISKFLQKKIDETLTNDSIKQASENLKLLIQLSK